MCENLSPSWSEIRVETYQYFSMKADIHIVNSKIKSKNLCQSIRKKAYLTLVHTKKQAEIVVFCHKGLEAPSNGK